MSEMDKESEVYKNALDRIHGIIEERYSHLSDEIKHTFIQAQGCEDSS